jgi:nucleoid-associated protein YgaU
MTKTALIWTLLVAVVVGTGALVTGYIYSGAKLQDTAGTQKEEVVATAPADSGKSDKQGSGEQETSTETGQAPPAADAAAGAEPAAGDEGSLSFDVVGVEPTGDAVVAGRSEPGAIVALTANGKVVGKTVANNKGEWTIILDKPLDAGDYDVGLQVQDETGAAKQDSTQRLAVSIPEGGKEQPLVVLNAPDAPSRLLQKPAPAATGGETQVASSETAQDTGAAVVAEKTEAAGNEAAAVTAEAQPAVEAETAEPDVDAKEPAAKSGAVQETVVAEGKPAVSDAPQDSAVEASPAPEGDAPTEVASQDVPEAMPELPADKPADQETAAVQAETTTPTAKAVETPAEAAELTVTVDAVEAEKGTVYVAGTGAAKRTVQVYVGEKLLAGTVVGDNGRWLVEGKQSVAAGSVEVRADMIGDDGKVIARAAVTFEKEDEAIVLTKVNASGDTAGNSAAAGATVTKPLPNVIIRKGDNLWRISRRLYGSGFRYTTIYQANKQQIRNPDLIYPGQVFLTPEGDLNWSKDPQN